MVTFWHDWAGRNVHLDRLCDAHTARQRRRKTAALFAVLRQYAVRKRATARLVVDARRRGDRHKLRRVLRAWADTASEEVQQRRLSAFIHVSDAAALLHARSSSSSSGNLADATAAAADRRHSTVATPTAREDMARAALRAWRATVTWCRRAAFLVSRAASRRATASQRAALLSWRAATLASGVLRKEWTAVLHANAVSGLGPLLRGWLHAARAERSYRKHVGTRALSAWTAAVCEAHTDAATDVATSAAAGAAQAAAFRAWRGVAAQLVAAADAVEDALDVDDVAARVRDALAALDTSLMATPAGVGGDVAATPLLSRTANAQPLVASPAELRSALAAALRETVRSRLMGDENDDDMGL